MLPALALIQACSALSVESDVPAMREAVLAAFASRGGIDTCARVTLTSSRLGTIVTVTLPDGRNATRVVKSEDVVGALEPLLLLPETTESEVASAPTLAPASVVTVVDDDRPRAPVERTAKRLGFEGSVGFSARMAANRPGGGATFSALVDANGWLGGLTGRFERYEVGWSGGEPSRVDRTAWTLPTLTTQSVYAGVLAGRRAHYGVASVDVYGGAGVAYLKYVEPDAAQVVAWIGPAYLAIYVPQFTVGTRVTLRARSLMRFFLAVEADARLGDDAMLPRLGIGASLGFAVGS